MLDHLLVWYWQRMKAHTVTADLLFLKNEQMKLLPKWRNSKKKFKVMKLFYSTFLKETISFTNEAIIAAEQHLTKENVTLQRFPDWYYSHAHLRYIGKLLELGNSQPRITTCYNYLLWKKLRKKKYNWLSLNYIWNGVLAGVMKQILTW